MNQIAAPVISRRQKTAGANHHLWNNNGTWWLYCTIHMPDFTKWRLRRKRCVFDAFQQVTKFLLKRRHGMMNLVSRT